MSALMKSFGFGEQLVRAVDREDGIWFVGKDVCAALDIVNHRQAISALEDDERDDVHIVDAIGRSQEMLIVSESGMYALVFKSRKASAKAFRRWVTQEVLPAIRQTGRFEAANDRDELPPTPEQRDLADARRDGLALVREARIIGGRAAARRAWVIVGLPDVFDDAGPLLLETPGTPIVQRWFADRAEPAAGVRTRTMELFADFETWCAEHGEPVLTMKGFAGALRAMGIASIKSNGMYRVGVRLRG